MALSAYLPPLRVWNGKTFDQLNAQEKAEYQKYLVEQANKTFPMMTVSPQPVKADWNEALLPGNRYARASSLEDRMMQAIAMRLGISEGERMFDYIGCHKLNEDKVAVFVAHNEQAVVIEADMALFPNDKLITQLALLRG